MSGAPGSGAQDDERGRALAPRLDTWVRERLITQAEADRIAAYEARHAPAGAPPRGSPVSEALAYLGGALAVAAAAIVVVRVWDDLLVAGRVAIAGVTVLVLFAAGWVLRGAPDPARARLARVNWFLSVVASAWAAAIVVGDGFGAEDRWPVLWAGGLATTYALALYLLRPGNLQQLAIVGALGLFAGGLFYGSGEDVGFAIWGIGVAFIVLGWRGWLADRGSALAVGALAALVGAIIVPATLGGEWLPFGIVSAAGLIGAGVAVRHNVMLVLGAIGLFESTFGTVQHYLGGGLGAAAGLLVAGVLVLGLALLVSRMRRESGGGAAGK